MKNVVTRFAPSPTGMGLHLGSARTALFNFLYAKHTGGKFLLRIEDTDKDRSTKEAVDAIFTGLKMLGIDFDGDPVFQSANADRHREVARALLDSGNAYKCYMTAEDTAAWKAENKGFAFRSIDRDPVIGKDGPYVIRFKGPIMGETIVHDLVKGDVRFANKTMDDLVLLRSDGTPTYNLAVVVDDHDAGITHVIRGDDHLNNAARQKLIYEALGWDVPKFGHIPLIHGPKGKMSKRDGATAVEDYFKDGYLPVAFRNYLTRLGWGHGNDEIFSDAEAIEWFDIKDVLSSPAKFDLQKLNHVNHHYIQKADLIYLARDMRRRLITHDIWIDDLDYLANAASILREGAYTLKDLTSAFAELYRPSKPDDKVTAILSDSDKVALLKESSDALRSVDDWSVVNLNTLLHKFVADRNLGMGAIGPVMRAALTGRTKAPDLGTCLVVIGKNESLARISK